MGGDRDCFSCVDCPRNTLSLSNALVQAVIQNDSVGIAPEALARASSQGIVVMRRCVAGFSARLPSAPAATTGKRRFALSFRYSALLEPCSVNRVQHTAGSARLDTHSR
jgi:hypothetical protein